MTRSESREMIERWIKQNVNIVDPPVSSPAALALLSQKYFAQDTSIYTEARMTRLRHKWIKTQKQTIDKDTGFACAICGKTHLTFNNKNYQKRATLDHIHDISLGGKWNDPNNFQVACAHCNHHKQDILKKALTKKKKYRNIKNMDARHIVRHERLRIMIYPKSIGWSARRKCFKPLGFIFNLGRVRISCTIIKSNTILFNPYTLESQKLN